MFLDFEPEVVLTLAIATAVLRRLALDKCFARMLQWAEDGDSQVGYVFEFLRRR